MMNKLKSLKIGEFISRLPIVQGGMGVGVSLAGLAAAVAEEGGIGVIAASGIGMNEPDFNTNHLEANLRALRNEIRKAKLITLGVIGVNIMVAFHTYSVLVQTAIEEKVDIIFSGAGLPLNLPQFLKEDSVTKLVPIVSSARALSLICRQWQTKYNYLPDAVVVEGPQAGGHLGFKLEQIDDPAYALENLIPPILSEIKKWEDKSGKEIPLIAAGGIYDAKDMKRFFDLGVQGVQLGTRFVATTECDVDESFKESYLTATKDDIMIIKSPVGMPGRAIRNKFLQDVAAGETKPYKCHFRCIITCDFKNTPYCIANALINARNGNFDEGFAFCGANAYRVDKIVSVKELMRELVTEYNALPV